MDFKKLSRRSALLTLDSGEQVDCTYLGRGRFSEAWKNCTSVYVFTKETNQGVDYAKEIMANLIDLNNPHIPSVTRLGHITLPGGFGNPSRSARVYKMPLYNKLKAKEHKTAWSQRKELELVKSRKFHKHWGFDLGATHHDECIARDRINRETIEEARVPDSLRSALEEIYSQSQGYMESPMLEFPVKNLVVDNDGTLVLLDPIFDAALLAARFK